MKETMQKLKKKIENDLALAGIKQSFEVVKKKYLGRKGELTALLRKLKGLSSEQRKEIGTFANQLKKDIEAQVARGRSSQLAKAEEFSFDRTVPGIRQAQGHLHPITIISRKLYRVLSSMGFSYVHAPHVDTEHYVFDFLNVPRDHPSRDMQDTFHIVSREEDEVVLRTHTTSFHGHLMDGKRKPPVRAFTIGPCFRSEATDASHEAAFHQCDALVIDRGVRMTDLIGTLKSLFQALFGDDTDVRVLPHFFPFVEPAIEMAISCIVCKKKGCSVCKQTGWLEILGAGMVHPNELEAMRVDPKEYAGFAFGMGVDRIAMLYYQVNDIRLFRSGDLRFNEQF